jgi:hypothetical protein
MAQTNRVLPKRSSSTKGQTCAHGTRPSECTLCVVQDRINRRLAMLFGPPVESAPPRRRRKSRNGPPPSTTPNGYPPFRCGRCTETIVPGLEYGYDELVLCRGCCKVIAEDEEID